jgi:hypothetical protein
MARRIDPHRHVYEPINWNPVEMNWKAVPEVVFTVDTPMTKEEWDAARAELRKAYGKPEGE